MELLKQHQREGCKDGQEAGATFHMRTGCGRVGVVKHGEAKFFQGDFIAAVQYLKGACKKDGDRFLSGGFVATGHNVMVQN